MTPSNAQMITSPTITSRTQMIGQKEARAILDRALHNRPLRVKYVEQLAHEMEQGRWSANGEPIILDGEGRLMDGQHRLHAIVKADVIIPMLVVHGASGMDTIDCGAPRRVYDVLALRGMVNTKAIAAALQMLYAWDCGDRSGRSVHTKITNSIAESIMSQYPTLADSVGLSRGAPRGMPASILAVAHQLFLRVAGAHEADRFVTDLILGAGLDVDDPALVLRNRLVGGIMTRTNTDAHRWTVLALMIKAWNARRKGLRTSRSVPVPKDGGKFPEPV